LTSAPSLQPPSPFTSSFRLLWLYFKREDDGVSSYFEFWIFFFFFLHFEPCQLVNFSYQ
jgi:hypothetical protein